MPVLSIWSPEDGVLGAVAPLALGAAAGTALVVDLDPEGPHYPGAATLADLVAQGPRRDDLSPRRRGLAVMRNGGIGPDAASEVVEALVAGWPAMVLRLPRDTVGRPGALPILPLLPGGLLRTYPGSAVYQQSGWRLDPPGDGLVLPRPRRNTIGMLLTGVVPPPGNRWIRAWKRVWSHPWL
jgi:hypothetical protein